MYQGKNYYLLEQVKICTLLVPPRVTTSVDLLLAIFIYFVNYNYLVTMQILLFYKLLAPAKFAAIINLGDVIFLGTPQSIYIFLKRRDVMFI